MWKAVGKFIQALIATFKDHHAPTPAGDHGKIMTTIVVLVLLIVWASKNHHASGLIDIGENMLWLIAACLGITISGNAAKSIFKKRSSDDATQTDPAS